MPRPLSFRVFPSLGLLLLCSTLCLYVGGGVGRVPLAHPLPWAHSLDCTDFAGPCSRTLGGLDQPHARAAPSSGETPAQATPRERPQKEGGEGEEGGGGGRRDDGHMTADGVVRVFRERIAFTCQLHASRSGEEGADGVPTQQTTRLPDKDAPAGACGGGEGGERPAPFNLGFALPGDLSALSRRYRRLSGNGLHVLLGLPEAALQGPLRRRGLPPVQTAGAEGHGEGNRENGGGPLNGAAAASHEGGPVTVAAGRSVWMRLWNYPWAQPSALVRLFAIRTISIRFPIESHGDGAGREHEDASLGGKLGQRLTRRSRAALLSEGSLKRLRIVSYPAVPVEVAGLGSSRQLTSHDTRAGVIPLKGIRLTCDLSFVLYARACLRKLQELNNDPERAASLQKGVQGGEYVDEEEDQEYVQHAGARGEGLLGRLFTGRKRGLASGGVIYWIGRVLGRFFGLSQHYEGYYSAHYPEEADDFGEERGSGDSHTLNVSSVGSYPGPSPQVMYDLKDFLSRLREELGPYQPHAQPWLPEWVQQLLGRRVLSVEKYIEVRDRDQESHLAASPKEESRNTTTATNPLLTKDLYFTWKATLPATQTTCLALAVVSPARDKWDTTPSLPIHLEEFLVFDFLWLKLVLVLAGLRLLQVHMVNSRLLRILFSAVYGAFILIILFILYFMRELQALSVGRIGVVVILAVGGVAALAEVVLSAVGYVLANPSVLGAGMFSFLPLGFQELLGGLPAGAAWGVAALFAGTLSSLLMHLFFPDRLLRAGARWGMHGLLVANILLLVAQNREATFVTLLVWYGGPYLHALGRCLMETFRGRGEADLNVPNENLPPAAYHEVPFARPMAVEGRSYLAWRAAAQKGDFSKVHHGVDSSNNTLQRYGFPFSTRDGGPSLYEEEGAAHTRRALEELAMQIRANPRKYSQRLRNPNAVHQWAGVGVCDDESDNSGESS